MAAGLAPATANSLLDALFNQTNYTAPTALWIQLHTGDPGAAGSANIASETTRKDVTTSIGAAAGGAVTNTVAVDWTSVTAPSPETYTYFSIHSASTAGTFYCSGTVTASQVTGGDNFSIPIGDLDFTLNVAA